MARPYKHPKSGVYYYRQRIPTDLHPILGNKIISRSLETKDPLEAKVRNAEKVREQAMIWETYRKRPSPLPMQKIAALCGVFYRDYMTILEIEPGEMEIWKEIQRLCHQLDASLEKDLSKLSKWYGPTVDNLLLQHSLVVDDNSRDRLLTQLHQTVLLASEQHLKRSQGDYSPDPNLDRFPDASVLSGDAEQASTAHPAVKSVSAPNDAATVSIWKPFKLWEKDHLADGKSHKTVGDYRQKVQSLVSYAGHEDLSIVSQQQVIDWCDHLRHEQGLAGKTVKAKYLAAVRVVCTVAKDRKLVEENPTDGVKVRATKALKSRPSGFTDEEALKILTAARVDPSALGRRAAGNKRAIRWGPWLCAFTGARVTEMMQLRKSDVMEEGGIHYLQITPEAGSVKTRQYRKVPLHPQLVELGFLDMVQDRPEGPLFFDTGIGLKTTLEDAQTAAENAGDKIRKWVRDVVGIDDKRLQPNHAWRHRFKTICRDVGINPEAVNAIVGHEDGSASSHYGEFTIRALNDAIIKLPKYELASE